MTTVAQIRKAALALSEVVEGTHFGMVAFAVREKSFASITKDGTLQVQLAPTDIDQTLVDLPAAEPLVRMGTPIGVRVPLDAINGMQSNALMRRAWISRAPKRLAAVALAADRAEPGHVGDLPESLGRPATRALVAAELTTLAMIAAHGREAVAGLHGVGPKAVAALDAALAVQGLRWSDA